MRQYKSLQQIKKACEEVQSCATGSDRFIYRCFPFLVEQLVAINEKLKAGRKREPSAYNLHIAKEMADGKSLQEAVATYKAHKK